MARIATSIEESKRLLELGIDPKSANMCWTNASFKGINYVDPWRLNPLTVDEVEKTLSTPSSFFEWTKGWEVVPAWSLDGLLKLLPNDIAVSFQNGNDEGTLYWVDTFLATTFSDTYIGAMVEMIELLVEEGYIKGKEK